MKTKCRFQLSIFKDTWFGKSKLSVKKNFIFICLYLVTNFNSAMTGEVLEMNKNSITDYCNFAREVFADYCFENQPKIGGHGSVVQINKAKFGKRKYPRGRMIEGQWIFGGIDSQ